MRASTEQLRRVRNPPRHTVQRGARSERVKADRGLPGGRTSAEPANAGREGTSDPNNGPASESAMERETEPMAEAPLERQLTNSEVGE